ncbi:MAG: lipoate--protein ligase family protein [Dehalococcoidia bacterium]|nr:lipoate--protein ligase family protein [Dehalococcoidia bacterium]
MTQHHLRLVGQAFPDRPAFDTAVSRALLQRASDGLEPATLRLYRPAAIVAFGPQDVAAPGFGAAVHAAQALGFAGVLRLAGGRAAAFHEATLAFSWTIPDADPIPGTHRRFRELAEIMLAALGSLGIDARIGGVAGEYCPGEYSVNAGGRTKLMGVGQRMVSRAAHVGGVVVVGDSYRIRDVLLPVNQALGLAWDPDTVGSVEDETGVSDYPAVAGAIERAFAERYALEPVQLSPEVLALAATLTEQHAARP